MSEIEKVIYAYFIHYKKSIVFCPTKCINLLTIMLYLSIIPQEIAFIQIFIYGSYIFIENDKNYIISPRKAK